MLTKFRWTIVAAFFLTLLSVWIVLPNFMHSDNEKEPALKTIKLGLDLKGGSHLLLQVNFDSYVNEQLNFFAEKLRKVLRENALGYWGFHTDYENINFQIENPDQSNQIKNLIRNLDNRLHVEIQANSVKIYFSPKNLDQLKAQVIEQTIEIVRNRIDYTGTTEPIIQRQGRDKIVLEVPGVADPAKIKQMLGTTAKLSFHIVENLSASEKIKPGLVLAKGDHNGQEYSLLIKKQPSITGNLLKDAHTTLNQHSQPLVAFAFNKLGSRIFADLTKNNTGKQLAILLDGKILSAPVINEPILHGEGTIQGNFTIEEASKLSLLLKAGALPAPVKVIEEKIVGPSLGEDSVLSGKKAGIISFTLIVIFMVSIYGLWGIFASITLALSLLYMFAALSLLQATLTLPGIAGIVLTIGMAVDANILIYERIREELIKESSLFYSIKEGFRSAFSTIADSNITTLIAAATLYIFGTGPIKGFSVTLSIGIVCSMYSTIVITKLFIDTWAQTKKPSSKLRSYSN